MCGVGGWVGRGICDECACMCVLVACLCVLRVCVCCVSVCVACLCVLRVCVCCVSVCDACCVSVCDARCVCVMRVACVWRVACAAFVCVLVLVDTPGNYTGSVVVQISQQSFSIDKNVDPMVQLNWNREGFL